MESIIDTPKGRRLAIMAVSQELLFGLFRDGLMRLDEVWEVTENKLPDDATFAGAQINMHGNLELLVHSDEFEPLPEGKRPPILSGPVCKLINAKD